jgi:hypothetical protein
MNSDQRKNGLVCDARHGGICLVPETLLVITEPRVAPRGVLLFRQSCAGEGPACPGLTIALVSWSQAAEKLVRFGQQVGVTPEEMISLLNSGISIRELLAFLAAKNSLAA